MYTKFKIRSIIPSIMMAAVAVLFMGSCTVYKYVDAPSEDGIYSSSREYRGQADNYSESNNYYRQYFQSKQGAYSEILGDQEESAIFTDVEAYNTREYIGDDGYVYSERISQEEQYAGWGNNASTVSINLYGGYGGYGGGYYNSFYGNWGYPYYGHSYYPRWRSGFSWWYGWNGFYSPFYHSNYYYGNNYQPYRPYYDNVAYNRGRRNSDYSSRTATRGRTSNSNVSRGRTAAQSEGRRSTNTSTSRRGENNSINNNASRNATINSDARRSGVNTRRTDVQKRATTPTSRRVTFPQQSSGNNRATPSRTQPTQKQAPANTRRMQQPRQKPATRQQPSTRSSAPARRSSPSMRSAPTRSSAPASRGRSGSGRR